MKVLEILEGKSMTVGERLRLEREAAGLSRKKVADPLDRVGEWLRLIETGKRSATPATRAAIREVIRRLSAYRVAERRQRDAFIGTLALPRYLRSAPRKARA